MGPDSTIHRSTNWMYWYHPYTTPGYPYNFLFDINWSDQDDDGRRPGILSDHDIWVTEKPFPSTVFAYRLSIGVALDWSSSQILYLATTQVFALNGLVTNVGLLRAPRSHTPWGSGEVNGNDEGLGGSVQPGVELDMSRWNAGHPRFDAVYRLLFPPSHDLAPTSLYDIYLKRVIANIPPESSSRSTTPSAPSPPPPHGSSTSTPVEEEELLPSDVHPSDSSTSVDSVIQNHPSSTSSHSPHSFTSSSSAPISSSETSDYPGHMRIQGDADAIGAGSSAVSSVRLQPLNPSTHSIDHGTRSSTYPDDQSISSPSPVYSTSSARSVDDGHLQQSSSEIQIIPQQPTPGADMKLRDTMEYSSGDFERDSQYSTPSIPEPNSPLASEDDDVSQSDLALDASVREYNPAAAFRAIAARGDPSSFFASVSNSGSLFHTN